MRSPMMAVGRRISLEKALVDAGGTTCSFCFNAGQRARMSRRDESLMVMHRRCALIRERQHPVAIEPAPRVRIIGRLPGNRVVHGHDRRYRLPHGAVVAHGVEHVGPPPLLPRQQNCATRGTIARLEDARGNYPASGSADRPLQHAATGATTRRCGGDP